MTPLLNHSEIDKSIFEEVEVLVTFKVFQNGASLRVTLLSKTDEGGTLSTSYSNKNTTTV